MIIRDAKIEAVAVRASQYPQDNMAEIAFAGRSNVGKSSLLNLLTGRKSLARVSGSPGKTRTINFYNINDEFRIVDLPGYGYATVSKSMSKDWGPMMEEYFQKRSGLKRVVQLVDIRHAPSAQDVQMYQYLRHYGLDGTVVATKADKISRNEMSKCIAVIRRSLDLSPEDTVIPVSALKRTGQGELLDHMVLSKRIKAISSMMKDKTVPKRKKLLIVLGIIYLFLPIDLIPPVLFPFGFLDDLVLWIWIIWHLKDTLDQYWVGEKEVDLSRDFKNKDIVEGVEFTVDQEDEEDE